MKKKRIISLLLGLVMVLALLPTAALAATPVNKITITMTKPKVGQPLPTDAKVTTASTQVTKVEWSPTSPDGTMQYDTAYTVTLTVEMKPDKDNTFSTKTINVTINNASKDVTVNRVSDTMVKVTYSYAAVKSNETKEAETVAALDARRMTMAEADEKRPMNDPITIVVNKDTVDTGRGSAASYVKATRNKLTTLDGQEILDVLTVDGTHSAAIFRITGVVYDLYTKEPTGTNPSFTDLPNVKEIWLSPEADVEGFLESLPRGQRSSDDHSRNHFGSYDKVVLIPASLYPNGPAYAGNSPSCHVMLYDGDVYEAARKGVSAARDWCANHSYTAKYLEPDRFLASPTCTEGSKYYYSCSRCGRIEYNANHTWDANAEFGIKRGGPTAHSYSVQDLSDEHFVGINAEGDRVYLLACEFCGKDKRYHALNMTIDELIRDTGPTSWESYQLVMSRSQKAWAEGGSSYKNALKATVAKNSHGCFAVSSDTFVWATHSGWARNDLNTASELGLIDAWLLGNDYTAAITREQFASVAVKMTEKMLGTSIIPAPAGTFSDTDNEYARKAYAAGITTGTGDGSTFDPNGTLTRQQMATFLYRALQYVKANSDTRYSPYASRLSEYGDAGGIESWAADAMAFMNAFGLVNGSDNKLSPNASCPIEQAVIVALRSLDAGRLGWYQNVSDMNAYGGKPVVHMYGDRIWVTGVYATGSGSTLKFHGNCIDPYGRSSQIILNDTVAAIKEL